MRLILLLFALLLAACNVQTGKSHYILAERLFGGQKYLAAIQEFQKVVDSDPKGALAQQALFRIGMIQQLYLERYADAVKSFKQFTLFAQNNDQIYQAEKNVGDLLYEKLEDYRGALDQYKRLLDRYPRSIERDFFLLRMAKSYYGALDFQKAIDTYRELLKAFPQSALYTEALYQIGNTLYTRGDCDQAVKVFDELQSKYAQASQAVHAKFGKANCLEEMERYSEALELYRELLETHPSRQIVEAKIHRLELKQAKSPAPKTTKRTRKKGT